MNKWVCDYCSLGEHSFSLEIIILHRTSTWSMFTYSLFEHLKVWKLKALKSVWGVNVERVVSLTRPPGVKHPNIWHFSKNWRKNHVSVPGPQLDPLECGTPIFCIFYGIISIIFLFAVYSNIKGDMRLVLNVL